MRAAAKSEAVMRGAIRAEGIRPPASCSERSARWIVLFGARPFAWMTGAFLLAGVGGLAGWSMATLCLLVAQRHFQTLVHDGSHGFYARKRELNDRLANWLAAGWIGMTVDNYRRIHLRHHACNGSADDPEHVSFATVAEAGGLAMLVLRYACLLEALRLLRKYYGGAGEPGRAPRASDRRPKRSLPHLHVIGAQSLLAGACLVLGLPALYPIWLYLAMSWSPLLSRLRFLVEHPGDHDLTVTTLSNGLERPLFAPLNFNFHFEHHAWPAVPPYRLGELHRHLRQIGFYDRHPQYENASFVGSLVRRDRVASAALDGATR
jgi:fatty acid desaturase